MLISTIFLFFKPEKGLMETVLGLVISLNLLLVHEIRWKIMIFDMFVVIASSVEL
jgi:hypothetical protein